MININNEFFCFKEPKLFGQGNKLKILCLDCGIKENIIRNLVKRGAEVKVVPWNYNFRNEKYDGLFISNGPGDPTLAVETIANIKHVNFSGFIKH